MKSRFSQEFKYYGKPEKYHYWVKLTSLLTFQGFFVKVFNRLVFKTASSLVCIKLTSQLKSIQSRLLLVLVRLIQTLLS